MTVADHSREAHSPELEERVRFRALVENIADVICLADASCRNTWISPSLTRVLGYLPEERIGRSPFDLLHPDDRPKVEAAAAALQEQPGATHAFAGWVRHKDGSWRWVEATATNLLHDPAVRSLVINYRDLTEHRLAREELEKAHAELEARVARRTAELAQAKQQLEMLIAASPLSMIAVDRDLLVRMWNPAAESLFGWRQEEVLGQPLPNIPKENREHYLDELQRLACGPAGTCFETQRQKRDGSILDVSIWPAPLLDAQGGQTGCMGITMDITERKRLERALLEASEREQRRIGQDLHDHLCQHLLGVAFMLKVLANSAESEGSKRARELHQAAALVNEAVQQARDVARGLHPVALDAEGLMSALRELASHVTPVVNCELDCPQPVLIEDSTAAMHFYRIAQEAVTNAIKHSGARRIRIRLREDRDKVELRIRDDGRGFPPEKADVSRAGGMGLDIMKYRAHAIGGRLLLESHPAGGAVVTCTIPKPPHTP
jgi:two-component system, LuxR family, sensor kinase FixL